MWSKTFITKLKRLILNKKKSTKKYIMVIKCTEIIYNSILLYTHNYLKFSDSVK